LTKAGYSVITARSGKKAIELARSRLPNLILLDISMPEMDGGEVAHILRTDPQTKDIPIIYVTVLVTKEEEVEISHPTKGDYFIAKPYNLNDLLAQIQKCI
jgi:two-component system sensor histidine kinase/response regulator